MLRENPDAWDARELLHSCTGASIAVPDPPTAPPAPPESTVKNALVAFPSSREAIVTRQAEIAARTQRLIIEAKSLITGGRTAEAMPLLTSVLSPRPPPHSAQRL